MTSGPNETTTPNGFWPRAFKGYSFARLRRLALKELRETLRDRRTIFTLVLMPLLLYPILSLIFQHFLISGVQQKDAIQFEFGFESEADKHVFYNVLHEGGLQLLQELPESERETSDRAALARLATNELNRNHWNVRSEKDTLTLEDYVQQGTMDVGIRIEKTAFSTHISSIARKLKCELIYSEDSIYSQEALGFLSRRLEAVNAKETKFLLSQLGLPATVIAESKLKNVEANFSNQFSIATLVPLILILMTITGAVYPAIDLTAGERERGTLETLIAAPIPRVGLLLAKYIAVLTVSLMTAMVNIVGMMTTIWAFQLGPLLFGTDGVSLLTILQIFFLLVLFAGFFSAVLLTLTSFARSFKEAQAYLIPLMLVSLTPGFLSLMPGIKLNVMLAVTPLVNIVLLARDIFSGEAEVTMAVVAVFSTIFYAFAAIALAAKIFGTDAILYGSEGTLGEVFKRPQHPRSYPSMMNALFCLALVFPLNFVALGGLGRLGEQSISIKLMYIAGATVIVFALIPVVIQIYSKVRLVDGLGMRPRNILPFFAALALGISCWPWVAETVRLSNVASEEIAVVTSSKTREEIKETNEKKVAEAERQYSLLREASPWLLIFCMAIVPAVCEELFFRGIILRSLLSVISPTQAVIASAVVFGVFHVLSSNILSFDRLLPSALMGLVLGWVCYKSGSILPGIGLHAIHNSSLQMLGFYRDEIVAKGWVTSEMDHLPITWLAVSGVIVALASIVLMMTKTPTLVSSES